MALPSQTAPTHSTVLERSLSALTRARCSLWAKNRPGADFPRGHDRGGHRRDRRAAPHHGADPAQTVLCSRYSRWGSLCRGNPATRGRLSLDHLGAAALGDVYCSTRRSIYHSLQRIPPAGTSSRLSSQARRRYRRFNMLANREGGRCAGDRRGATMRIIFSKPQLAAACCWR